MNNTLSKLAAIGQCGCELLQAGELVLCRQLACWSLNDVPVCDEDIKAIAGLNGDNEAWLRPALADIHERKLAVGMDVRIHYGELSGKMGTIYNHLPSRPAPWHVRPWTWAPGEPGVACKADELEILDDTASVLELCCVGEDEETYPVVSVICDASTSRVLASCAPQPSLRELERVCAETDVDASTVEVLPALDMGEQHYQLLTDYPRQEKRIV